ncbi:3-keto-5-aminohexanoate cleavage protein (plasmid) [Streptomyces sp. HU2014]|uniref:3-keto-5-aminohexanoate cleavage protein n=1 Tax=Streptomyces sp. HU2014 TaxID=2939414 RepID=UPI00200FD657|nr:3-keto-5-aminohexanoate cleavage protein [Streptomyces sp. HU2014]UQI49668.1 3-keto-5-aminohexanoate cleavage protein [Streptomyces sp. HU2014]
MLQVCLNGSRLSEHCASLPFTPAELAEAARAAVAAGAEDIHLHPKGPDGMDTLAPDIVAATIKAVRVSVPGIPVGITTGAWAVPDAERRADMVRSWTVLPDHASVNWHEDGADLVAGALCDKGIAIEAGIYSGTDAAARFRTSPFAERVLRVLAEIVDTDPCSAVSTADHLLQELGTDLPAPVLLHGEDGGAWTVLHLATRLGLATRIGLEDVLHTPDGAPATDNAALVRAARALWRAPH